MGRRAGLLIVCIVIAQACALAWADENGSVLIRNVRLIDRDGKAEDATVSLLIKDGALDVVTRDEIPAAEAALVLDAENGVLIGKLSVGEPANFLILDGDPRETVEVLLDTKAHTLFAIHEGEILSNALGEMTEADPEPKRRGWLAYTPPPMALPTSYQDEKKWNRWESKYISGIFVSGLVLDRQRWISQDAANRQQVGDLGPFDGGEIRGFRFGAIGTLNFKKPWVYTFFAATNTFDQGFDTDRDEDLAVFDYRLDIPLPGKTTLSVGKQKEPISMERIMSMAFLPMQERTSVSDALLPARNVGIVLSGTAGDQRVTWAGGLFNDAIDHSESLSESSSQVIGRVTGLPFLSEDESNLVHLGLGVRYSNVKEGILARTEPEFNNAPDFVDTMDTGTFFGDSATIYDLEVSWRKGRFWVAGEYLFADVDSPAFGDPDFNGYHVTASWVLSGEMRAYNRKSGIFRGVPVAKSVYQGGWGAWELGLRWSSLDLVDGAVDGGEMGIASVGVNWWLTPTFNVNLNYRHIGLDRRGLVGDAQGMNTRVLLMLE